MDSSLGILATHLAQAGAHVLEEPEALGQLPVQIRLGVYVDRALVQLEGAH